MRRIDNYIKENVLKIECRSIKPVLKKELLILDIGVELPVFPMHFEIKIGNFSYCSLGSSKIDYLVFDRWKSLSMLKAIDKREQIFLERLPTIWSKLICISVIILTNIKSKINDTFRN